MSGSSTLRPLEGGTAFLCLSLACFNSPDHHWRDGMEQKIGPRGRGGRIRGCFAVFVQGLENTMLRLLPRLEGS